jgi:hypothetical protein
MTILLNDTEAKKNETRHQCERTTKLLEGREGRELSFQKAKSSHMSAIIFPEVKIHQMSEVINRFPYEKIWRTHGKKMADI